MSTQYAVVDGTYAAWAFCSYGPCERDDLEQRMKRAVAALGRAEVADIVEQEGKIEVGLVVLYT